MRITLKTVRRVWGKRAVFTCVGERWIQLMLSCSPRPGRSHEHSMACYQKPRGERRVVGKNIEEKRTVYEIKHPSGTTMTWWGSGDVEDEESHEK